MSEQWKNMLWDAVEEAVRVGVDPKAVKKELRECWAEALRQEAQYADKVLRIER